MISNFKLFCQILTLVACTSALYVQVDQQPFCLTLQPLANSEYHLYYDSINQKSTLSVIISYANITQTRNFSSNHIKIPATHPIHFCLQTKNSLQQVSIDIYHSQQQQYKSLALKSQVHEVHEELINVGLQLKQIKHNEQFGQQRQVIQTQIIQKHENLLFLSSVVKISVVVLLILGQMWILNRVIRGNMKNFLKI